MKGFSEEQINELIAITRDTMRRDREIREILQSIVELQELFKEFSTLVIEQGTLLDRIDYNLENVQATIDVANVNIEDAIRYTKYSRWTICVLLLVVLLVGVIAILAIRLAYVFIEYLVLNICRLRFSGLRLIG